MTPDLCVRDFEGHSNRGYSLLSLTRADEATGLSWAAFQARQCARHLSGGTRAANGSAAMSVSFSSSRATTCRVHNEIMGGEAEPASRRSCTAVDLSKAPPTASAA